MIIIYSTSPSLTNAKLIADSIVKLKLAACVNIIDKVHSVYLWEGRVCNDSEFSLIIKTKEELFEKVQREIIKLHPYDTPCIISISVNKIAPEFENWINSVI